MKHISHGTGRVLAAVLAAAMILTSVPDDALQAFAAEAEENVQLPQDENGLEPESDQDTGDEVTPEADTEGKVEEGDEPAEDEANEPAADEDEAAEEELIGEETEALAEDEETPDETGDDTVTNPVLTISWDGSGTVTSANKNYTFDISKYVSLQYEAEDDDGFPLTYTVHGNADGDDCGTAEYSIVKDHDMTLICKEIPLTDDGTQVLALSEVKVGDAAASEVAYDDSDTRSFELGAFTGDAKISLTLKTVIKNKLNLSASGDGGSVSVEIYEDPENLDEENCRYLGTDVDETEGMTTSADSLIMHIIGIGDLDELSDIVTLKVTADGEELEPLNGDTYEDNYYYSINFDKVGDKVNVVIDIALETPEKASTFALVTSDFTRGAVYSFGDGVSVTQAGEDDDYAAGTTVYQIAEGTKYVDMTIITDGNCSDAQAVLYDEYTDSESYDASRDYNAVSKTIKYGTSADDTRVTYTFTFYASVISGKTLGADIRESYSALCIAYDADRENVSVVRNGSEKVKLHEYTYAWSEEQEDYVCTVDGYDEPYFYPTDFEDTDKTYVLAEIGNGDTFELKITSKDSSHATVTTVEYDRWYDDDVQNTTSKKYGNNETISLSTKDNCLKGNINISSETEPVYEAGLYTYDRDTDCYTALPEASGAVNMAVGEEATLLMAAGTDIDLDTDDWLFITDITATGAALGDLLDSSYYDFTDSVFECVNIRIPETAAGKKITLKVTADNGADYEVEDSIVINVAQNLTSLTVGGKKTGTKFTSQQGLRQTYKVTVNKGADASRLALTEDVPGVFYYPESGELEVDYGFKYDEEAETFTIYGDRTVSFSYNGSKTDYSFSFHTDTTGVENGIPTVKVAGVTDISFKLDLTLPKNLKYTDGLYYMVSAMPKDTAEAEAAGLSKNSTYALIDAEPVNGSSTVSTEIFVSDYPIKVDAEGNKTVLYGQGGAAAYDITAGLIYISPETVIDTVEDESGTIAKTVSDYLYTPGIVDGTATTDAVEFSSLDITQAELADNTYVCTNTDKIVKLTNQCTREPAYTSKVTLKSKTSTVYQGMENVTVATAQFDKITTHSYLTKVDVTPVYDDEDAGNITASVGSDGASVIVDVPENMTPGTYTLTAYAAQPDGLEYMVSSSVKIKVAADADPEATAVTPASFRILKKAGKDASVKVTTQAYAYTGEKAKAKSVTLSLADKDGVKLGSDYEGEYDELNEAYTDGLISIKSGTVKIAKNFVCAADDDENTFTVKAAIVNNGNTAGDKYSLSAPVVISAKPVSISKLLVVNAVTDEDDESMIRPTAEQITDETAETLDVSSALTTDKLIGNYVVALDDDGEIIDDVTWSASGKALTVDKATGEITGAGTPGKCVITATSTDGAKTKSTITITTRYYGSVKGEELRLCEVINTNAPEEIEYNELNYNGSENELYVTGIVLAVTNSEGNQAAALTNIKLTAKGGKLYDSSKAYGLTGTYCFIPDKQNASITLEDKASGDKKTYLFNTAMMDYKGTFSLKKTSGVICAGTPEQTLKFECSKADFDLSNASAFVTADYGTLFSTNEKTSETYIEFADCVHYYEFEDGALNVKFGAGESDDGETVPIPVGSFSFKVYARWKVDDAYVYSKPVTIKITSKAVTPKVTVGSSYSTKLTKDSDGEPIGYTAPLKISASGVYDTYENGLGYTVTDVRSATVNGKINHFSEYFSVEDNYKTVKVKDDDGEVYDEEVFIGYKIVYTGTDEEGNYIAPSKDTNISKDDLTGYICVEYEDYYGVDHTDWVKITVK